MKRGAKQAPFFISFIYTGILEHDCILRYFTSLTDKQISQFSDMYSVYASWNKKINLISRRDFSNFYVHHVLHSLSLAKVFSLTSGQTILDFGTGGGFPGVPLAILFPEAQFMLVDSIQKKVKAVENICQELQIKNVSVRSQRVEDMKEILFDMLICRAVSSVDRVLGWTRHLLKKKAKGWYLLKGENTESQSLKHRNHTIWAISDFFDESFFQTKQIIHLPQF